MVLVRKNLSEKYVHIVEQLRGQAATMNRRINLSNVDYE
jgi:hypothetical protein